MFVKSSMIKETEKRYWLPNLLCNNVHADGLALKHFHMMSGLSLM